MISTKYDLGADLFFFFAFSQSVSSDESVPLFELSRTSTVSSDNGVYPLRSSEGDVPDNDSLEDGENGAMTGTDEAVFAEPQVNRIMEPCYYGGGSPNLKFRIHNERR